MNESMALLAILGTNRQHKAEFVTQMFVTENGRQGNALAVFFFWRRACLGLPAHDFHCSKIDVQKRDSVS